jgi:2-dehydro-3-deoxyphosphooctonate aldolase (KDO 8-P synthase)
VVFDVTHCSVPPGGGDGVTAGCRVHRAAGSAGVAAGVDGIFLEVHEAPERAKSDAQNALRLDRLEGLLTRLVRLDAIAREPQARASHV